MCILIYQEFLLYSLTQRRIETESIENRNRTVEFCVSCTPPTNTVTVLRFILDSVTASRHLAEEEQEEAKVKEAEKEDLAGLAVRVQILGARNYSVQF